MNHLNHHSSVVEKLETCCRRRVKQDRAGITGVEEDVETWGALLENFVKKFRNSSLGGALRHLTSLAYEFSTILRGQDLKTTSN